MVVLEGGRILISEVPRYGKPHRTKANLGSPRGTGVGQWRAVYLTPAKINHEYDFPQGVGAAILFLKKSLQFPMETCIHDERGRRERRCNSDLIVRVVGRKTGGGGVHLSG